MNQKTEGAMDISLRTRRLLIVLTLLTLALVFSTERRHERRVQVGTGFQFTLYPWLHASALTVSNSLDLFSGRPLNPPTMAQHLSMLVGVLLSLVIAPACLILGWRSTVLRKQAGAAASPLVTLAFMAGGIVTIAVVFPAIPFAVEDSGRYKALQQAQDLGSNRDNLIHQLSIIAREARQYRILPRSAGGGSGSYGAFAIPDGLKGSEEGFFEVAEASADVLILKAQSKSRPTLTVRLSMDAAGKVLYSLEDL